MKRWMFLFVTIGLFFSASGQVKQLTLDECVQIALQKNPQLIQGQYSVKMMGKDMTSAVSKFLPSLSANVGYNHSVVGPSTTFRIDPRTGIPIPEQPFQKSWSSGTSFDVSQTIFDGAGIFNISKVQSLKKSAEYALEDGKQSVIYMVKERYYNLLKAEKMLGVQEETVLSSEESFKRAEVLFEVGKVPKSDVLKATVQMETDRLALIEGQNNLSIARASLNQVLGIDVNKEIEVVDNLDVPEVEVSYEDAQQSSSTYHPLLMKSITDLKASKAVVRATTSQFLPTISGYGSYSWRNEKFYRINTLLDKDYNWNLGIQASLPIFQGFSRLAEVDKAKLNVQWYREAQAQTKRDIALELKQSYFAVQQAKKKITVTQDAEDAASEDLRLNKEKYSLGSGTMLDLIYAQASYTRAKTERIQALYDYKYAIARLQKAMGKLER